MEPNDLCYVDATGFHRATYDEVLAYFNDIYRTIFGNDINIDPDTQDGDLIAAANARPLFDTILIAEAVYNSFSPAVAMSDALTRNVRINGIFRRPSTYSTVELYLVGSEGTIITNGIVQDTLNQKWLLPATVTIPFAGYITVTGTAQSAGTITTDANTITKIVTPTAGWISVNNPAVPTIGDAAETDPELRERQQISVSLPALSIVDSIEGNVASLTGVTRVKLYENDTDSTDGDGVPSHSISLVVFGGDDQEIGDTIAHTKAPGTGTYGTTSVDTYDAMGMLNIINFYRPTIADIGVEVTIARGTTYVSTTDDLIKAAVTNYINGLDIGEDVIQSKLYVPCYLDNTLPISETYEVTLIEIKRDAGSFGTANIEIDFNELAQTTIGEVTIIYA